MGDIPEPKFAIGQTVWYPQVIRETETIPCPDCGGERKWHVSTPAGDEFDIECFTCQPYSQSRHRLQQPSWRVEVEELTIGSIKIDTHDDDEKVWYMCRQTGVGSGRSYRESELFCLRRDAADRGVVLAERAEAEHLVSRTAEEARDLRHVRLRIIDRRIADAKAENEDAIATLRQWNYFLSDLHLADVTYRVEGHDRYVDSAILEVVVQHICDEFDDARKFLEQKGQQNGEPATDTAAESVGPGGAAAP